MKTPKTKPLNLAAASLLTVIGLTTSSVATATVLQSGLATIDLDPAAWLSLKSQTVTAVFNKTDMDTMDTPALLAAPLGSPSTTGLPFEMYTSNAPTGLAGRGPVNTTFDYNGTDATTSIGTIGLAGAWKTNSTVFTGQLIFGDFSLHYDAARVGVNAGGTSSGWTLTNHVSFAASTADLANVTLVNGTDGFTLSGDIALNAGSAGFLGGTAGQDVGDFSVTVSSVPVPAAVWLFGSGLVGLVGFGRKKKAAQI